MISGYKCYRQICGDIRAYLGYAAIIMHDVGDNFWSGYIVLKYTIWSYFIKSCRYELS